MNLSNIQYCPSTLEPGYATYSPRGMNDLFGSRSKKVSHILNFSAPGVNDAQTRIYNQKRKGISISGFQEKYSLHLNKKILELVDQEGHYILKPIPAQRLKMLGDIPANEHLTMQLASQVFGISTAKNGLIFFVNGSPAYITKRFDYKQDGTKYQIEDFATLIGRTPEIEGDEFKIKASYEDIADMIERYVPAAQFEKMKLFNIVLFNYAFSNGDAHLKNFSLLETDDGDYVLSPAYDMLCTALHVDDGNLSLQGGLYEKDYEAPAFEKFGFYTADDFRRFGERIGINPDYITDRLTLYSIINNKTIDLIERSFLSTKAKKQYKKLYLERTERFRMKLL